MPTHVSYRGSMLHLITHSDTRSVGLLWTTDRRVAEACTCTKHNIQQRQTSMPAAGFEHTIPASERLQTYALDCAASGICLVGTQELNTHCTIMSLVSRSYFNRCSGPLTPCLVSATPNKGHHVSPRSLQLKTRLIICKSKQRKPPPTQRYFGPTASLRVTVTPLTHKMETDIIKDFYLPTDA